MAGKNPNNDSKTTSRKKAKQLQQKASQEDKARAAAAASAQAKARLTSSSAAAAASDDDGSTSSSSSPTPRPPPSRKARTGKHANEGGSARASAAGAAAVPPPGPATLDSLQDMLLKVQTSLATLTINSNITNEKVSTLSDSVQEVKDKQSHDHDQIAKLAQRLDILEHKSPSPATPNAAAASASSTSGPRPGTSSYYAAASCASAGPPVGGAPWASWAGTSSGRTSAPAEPTTRRVPDGADPCKIWINGFARELLAKQLTDFGDSLLTRYTTTAIAAQCRVRAFHLNKSFTIHFPSDVAAKDFLVATREGCGDWQDPKGGSYPTTSRPDRDIPSRNVAKTIGDLWKAVFNHLKADNTWKPGWQLRSTGARGTLFLSHDHDNTVLFRIKPTKVGSTMTHQIEPAFDGLALLGLNRQAVDLMVSSARTTFEDRA